MKSLFIYISLFLLLIPINGFGKDTVPYKVYDLPESTNEIQQCRSDSKKLYADTISYNTLNVHIFALYCPGWGEDPLTVFNAENGQLLLDDPEGGLWNRKFPLAFTLSHDRTVLVSSTKTAIVNNTTGNLIQIIDNTLYEIADFNSDGMEDIAAITLTGGNERTPREVEVYLSNPDGSLELTGIGDIIIKDREGPVQTFNKEMRDPKRVKRDFADDYRHIQFDADSLEVLHGKPYDATVLFNRMVDFSSEIMLGLPLYKKSSSDPYRRDELRVSREEISTNYAKSQKYVPEIFNELTQEYKYCYQFYPYGDYSSGLAEPLKTILTCEKSFSDDRPIKKMNRYLILNNDEVIKDIEDIVVKTSEGEYWLAVNDKRIRDKPNSLVKLNDSLPELALIDLRRIAGIGYDESEKTITGKYIYVWKKDKIHVLDMLDVVKQR